MFLGLLFLGIIITVSLILPIVSFVRVRRAERLAEDALRRIVMLEERLNPTVQASAATAPAEDLEKASDVPAPVVVPPVVVPPVAAPSVTEDLPPRAPAAPSVEQVIGGRWLLYIGIGAVILGVSYFVKFAFDNGWISEPLRVAAGVATGVALIVAGLRLASRDLPLFGHALAGGGIVVLYVALYAALHFYGLIGRTPAFVAMVGVTVLGGWLADRQKAQPLAMLALIGGFATPLLVGGERGAQVVLFTYVAVLVAAAVLLTQRRGWPLLAAASYIGTFAIVVIWSFASYEASAWLRTHLFLTLFAALFGYALYLLLRGGSRNAEVMLAAAALVTAPLVYHLASMILLAAHPAAWLLYIACFTLITIAIGHRAGAAAIRLLSLIVVVIPAAAWLSALDQERWYAAAVVTMVVIYGLHLVAEWDAASRVEGELPLVAAAHVHLNGLLLPAALYAFIETRFAWWNPKMVAALAAWNAVVALAARGQRGPLAIHHTALSATLFAAALVLAFDGPAVAAGWGAEGVFLVWIALRERSRATGAIGTMLILLGAAQIVNVIAQPLAVDAVPFANARVLAAVVVISLLVFLTWRMRLDPADEVRGTARTGAIILANLLAIAALSAEILAFFDQRSYVAASAGEGVAAAAALRSGQVALSVAWAIYAVVLIAAGIRRRYAPARYLGIALFAVTLLKVMTRDIAAMDRVERMLTVLGVGVLLLMASYLYQRFALRTND